MKYSASNVILVYRLFHLQTEMSFYETSAGLAITGELPQPYCLFQLTGLSVFVESLCPSKRTSKYLKKAAVKPESWHYWLQTATFWLFDRGKSIVLQVHSG